MAKLWEGRFSKETDATVNDFNASIRFDKRLIKEDIEGSIAHASMLGATGIIGAFDAEAIVNGLKGIAADIESGILTIDESAEDVHTFVEGVLTERIGSAGKKLHTARSRNDQVALDMRLFVKKAAAETVEKTLGLIRSLLGAAEKNVGVIMPGYTHLQRAQPVAFSHYMLAYVNMFLRDKGRIEDCVKRADFLPLGSAALAGTSYPIDRKAVAESLGFGGVCANSLDGVSDRDFVLEFAFCLSALMMHLSRLSEEIILWNTSEFGFIELDDAFSTGSSIMPQKKNPDVAELTRGKTGRVYGDLMALLTVMKGLSLAYNKDMQEDKEALFDAFDTAKLCLTVTAGMIDTMKVNAANMEKASEKGFINATDAADYLTKKGVPFRDAYKCSGELVAECIRKGKTLRELSIEEFKAHNELFENDVYDELDVKNCAEKRTSYGGGSTASVLVQIEEIKEKLIKKQAD